MINELKMNEYQEKAMQTCMPTSNNINYMMLNLVGEVGELASKIAKGLRKETMMIERGQLAICGTMDEADAIEKELQAEAGDILWQLAGVCSVMGWKLDKIAQDNLDKLASRQQRGVIDGNGDNR